MLPLKQQRNRCPIMANEELPKEPKNMTQGAITQDAQGRDHGRPAPGATSRRAQAWAPGNQAKPRFQTQHIQANPPCPHCPT